MNYEKIIRTIDLLENLLIARLESFSKDNFPNHFTLPIHGLEVDLLDFLDACSINDKIYFKSLYDDSEILTFGCNKKIISKLSDTEKHFNTINRINKDKLSRFYAILSFQGHHSEKDTTWSNLDESIYIQPLIEIIKKKNNDAFLYVHYEKKESDYIEFFLNFFKQLKDSVNVSGPKQLESFKFEQFPNKKDWKENLSIAIEEMNSSVLQKVVLSRKSIATFKDKIDGCKLLKLFMGREKNCSVFYYEQTKESIFFSITPEKLYLRHKDYIEVDAIAGTRSISDNGFYSGELLSSTKDHLEHELVVQGIINNLQRVSGGIKIKYKHQLVKLSKVQHLKTLITAKLNKDSDDFKLISSLQPTAAIGGTPREDALKCISKIEQFNRGFYTGIAGLITNEYTEFLVLIRSCLIQANLVHFYVGAGIVPESNPEDEWEELNSKLANYMEGLNELSRI